MRNKYALLSALLVLALASMACGFNFSFDAPEINIQTLDIGPTVTEDIFVPAPDSSGTPELEIAFGAGELTINPGAESGLVEGTATFNVEELSPRVVEEGRTIRLQQGEGRYEGIPSFNIADDLVMEWDLLLSPDTQMDLVINGGANQTTVELGGLSLSGLVINQGAAESRFTFSEPNQVEMDSLEINAGAANLNLFSLANANVSGSIAFKGGAGNYTLDLSGELTQDLLVTIDAGLGNINVIVPADAATTLTLEGALTNVNTSGTWERSGSTYTVTGSGPQITIEVTMGAGNLDLSN